MPGSDGIQKGMSRTCSKIETLLSRVLRPWVHSANFSLTGAGRIDHRSPFMVNDSFCRAIKPAVRVSCSGSCEWQEINGGKDCNQVDEEADCQIKDRTDGDPGPGKRPDK